MQRGDREGGQLIPVPEKLPDRWNRRLWTYVLVCSVFIYMTIPVGRGLQKFIYQTVGKSFFTYAVLFMLGSMLVAVLYFLITGLKTLRHSQFIWIFACAGAYALIVFSIQEHPEEAVHFLEFGLLAYFLFRALSHKVRDWTVYPSTIFCVLLGGLINEFLQWMTPGRFWDFKDVGFDTLSGIIFVVGVWKGIEPEGVKGPVRKASVRLLINMVTLDLVLLGICLTNTPEAVQFYTAAFEQLSWLRAEEPMSEFRYPFLVWGAVLAISVTVRAYGRGWMKRLE